ncbi:protein kintoun [Syngnathus scovelli]|uniref:protein kintoun n=1 Tax=Syngnathus scovelli TaxID=161590 RepID=UPI00210FA870|nr:protein kintoun [Syngnathus scovelli]
MDIGEKLKELNMTGDEIKRLTKAFKDEKFREMLNDYAQEIADPENRRIYEEEIAILEKERGNTIEFIHPKPFRALRTSVNCKQKCYINICANDKVGKPECKWGVSEDGRRGQCWSLPHNLHPGRQDTDPKGNKVMIYDVIFHPDTLHIANKRAEFMQMVISTAIQGIQDAFKVTLDKNNVREMNTKYKGTPQPCVIRKAIPGYIAKPPEDHPLAFPYPDEKKSKTIPDPKPQSFKIQDEKSKAPTEPSYTVKYRSFIDLQDFRCSRDSGKSPRPKEIIITIDVPLLKSVSNANLEVKQKSLLLESETPAYRLELPLSYPVDEDRGQAKFSKQRGQLTVTLPVLPSNDVMEFCWSNNVSEGDTEEQKMEGEESQLIEGEVIKGQNGGQTVIGEEDTGVEEQLKDKGTDEELVEEEKELEENRDQNVLHIKEGLVYHIENKNEDPVKEEDVSQIIDSNQGNPASVDLQIPTQPSKNPSAQVKDDDSMQETAEEQMKKDQDYHEGEESKIGELHEVDISEEEQLTEKRTCGELEEEEEQVVEKKTIEEEEESGKQDALQSQVNLNEKESHASVWEEEPLTGKRRDEDTQENEEQDVLCIQESQTNLGENKNEAQVREDDAPQRMHSQLNPASQDACLDSSSQVENIQVEEAAETKEKDVTMELETLQEASAEATPTEIIFKNTTKTSETLEEPSYIGAGDKLTQITEESSPTSTKDEARMKEEEAENLPEKEIIRKPEPEKNLPPVSLREIDQDGHEIVFSDHATSAGFTFQNSLLYELD